jgi:hypothetical protein
LVFLRLCPIVNPSTAQIMSLAHNVLPTVRGSQTQNVTTVLPIRKRELACFVELAKKTLAGQGQHAFVEVVLEACSDR